MNRKSLLISLFFFIQTTLPVIDIEITKKTCIEILKKNNQSVLAEFNALCLRYDQLVIALFDHNNQQSLKKHIDHMEQQICVLNNIINDARFSSIRSILIALRADINEMVGILKQYIGSRNTISLALKLKHFEFLLPSPVKQRSLLSLFQSLQHRLNCIN